MLESPRSSASLCERSSLADDEPGDPTAVELDPCWSTIMWVCDEACRAIGTSPPSPCTRAVGLAVPPTKLALCRARSTFPGREATAENRYKSSSPTGCQSGSSGFRGRPLPSRPLRNASLYPHCRRYVSLCRMLYEDKPLSMGFPVGLEGLRSCVKVRRYISVLCWRARGCGEQPTPFPHEITCSKQPSPPPRYRARKTTAATMTSATVDTTVGQGSGYRLESAPP